jgi:uncharacterized protein YbaR (Trm112 family)
MNSPFSEILDLSRCPETGQRLGMAPGDLLERLRKKQAAGTLLYRSGRVVTSPLEAGLLREDSRVIYPIQDGIPVLVVDELIQLDSIG